MKLKKNKRASSTSENPQAIEIRVTNVSDGLSQNFTPNIAALQSTLSEIIHPINLDQVFRELDRTILKTKVRKNNVCTRGCTHCCNGSIPTTYAEALHISNKYNLPIRPTTKNTSREACRFLSKKNLCSIYSDRPIACRTKYQIKKVSLCKEGHIRSLITEKSIPAASQITFLLANYITDDNGVGVASINQWFPTQAK